MSPLYQKVQMEEIDDKEGLKLKELIILYIIDVLEVSKNTVVPYMYLIVFHRINHRHWIKS